MDRRLPPLIAALGLLVAAPAAQAGPSGFSDAQRLGDGRVSQPVGALLHDGTAAVAWVEGTGGSRIVVARRDGAAGPWRVRRLDRRSAYLRDVQVALDRQRRGLSVVWSEGTRRAQRVMAAVAARGGPLGAPARAAAVGSMSQAAPRLAVLRDGSTLLALRDGGRRTRPPVLRVLRRAPGRARFAQVSEIRRDVVRPAVAADAHGAAVLGWSAPLRVGDGGRRELRVLRLTGGGRPRGHSVRLAANTSGRLRLAAVPRGDVMASWTTAWPDGARAMLQRVLAPRERPLRLGGVRVLGGRATTPAALAFGPRAQGIAALRLVEDGYRIRVAAGTPAGPWRAVGPDTPPAAMVGVPSVLHAQDRLAIWSSARPVVGPAIYDVLVGPPGGTPQSAGVTNGPDGAGVVVAAAGDRALLAWPAVGGGVEIAERR